MAKWLTGMSLSFPKQNLLQCRKIQKLSVHYLFITIHMPVQVIHFFSVDTDHLGDSKLFRHIVLVYHQRGTHSFQYEYHSPFKNSCMRCCGTGWVVTNISKALWSSKTFWTACQAAQCQIPGDLNLRQHHCEALCLTKLQSHANHSVWVCWSPSINLHTHGKSPASTPVCLHLLGAGL